MLTPRPATLADADAVTALLQASYPRLLAGAYDAELLDRALPLMTRANPRLLASGTYFVVDGEQALLGAGGVTLDEPGTGRLIPGLAHLRHFATAPTALRRGVGRALVRACATVAAEAGARTLEAWSTLPAVPFYEASGLQVVERFDVPFTADLAFPSVRMRGDLSAILGGPR